MDLFKQIYFSIKLGEPFLDETIIGSVKQGSVVTSRELDAVIRTTQRRVNNVVRITRALNREVDLVNKSADEVLELAKQVAVVSTPKTTP